MVGPGERPVRHPLFLAPPTAVRGESWRRQWKCEEPRDCPPVEVVRVDELARAETPVARPRRAGDARSFEDLFAREFPRVARTIHHIVGDRARAEEVTQDAFLELLRHWRTVASYDRPDLWVRRVAIRKAQRERHRAWRRVELERTTVADESCRCTDARARGAGRRPPPRAPPAGRGRALLLRGPPDDRDRRHPGLLGVHGVEPAAHGSPPPREALAEEVTDDVR